VNWTAGDVLFNAPWPTFTGALMGGYQTILTPDSRYVYGVGLQALGNGINGNYTALKWRNNNSPTMYIGDGGLLTAPRGIIFEGPVSTALTTPAPIDNNAVIAIGCALDGCNSTNNTHILSINLGAGKMDYIPTTSQFFFTGVTTPKIQANVLSTGDGRYINNGMAGGAPVALTAASSLPNNQGTTLGTYGSLGNEFPMDTSADIAAHSFYAGLFHAGALPPTGVAVSVIGTVGSSTYSYVAVSNTQNGNSVQSGTITTTVGNATLSSSNNNAPQFIMGKGAQSTDVYRTAAPGGYGLGRICTAVDNASVGGNGDAPCLDTGQATTGSLPTNVDTSGNIQSAAATIGALTVTSCTGCGGGSGFITSLTTTGASGVATVSSGVLNIPNYTYTLPNATTSVLGGVKCDGTTITCTAGVIAAVGGGTGTVTHTAGALTAGAVVIGNTAADVKVDTGCSTDGAGTMTCLGFKTNGTTPTAVSLPAGVGSIPALAANSGGFAAPVTGGPAYLIKLPATITAGIPHYAAPATGDGVNESAMTVSKIALADLSATGTPSSTTYLRGDNTWATVTASVTFPWSCQPGLGDGLNAITAGTYLQTSCYNDTGQTVTLTGVRCYADAGTPTMNVTNGAGTGLLTGAVTCSTSFASGTQSGTTTIAAGDYLKFTFVASGTAKQATFVVTGTHP
jgi:hypothetical protein